MEVQALWQRSKPRKNIRLRTGNTILEESPLDRQKWGLDKRQTQERIHHWRILYC